MQAGWGQVAGNCDACTSDASTSGAIGAASVAALACAKSGAFFGEDTKCSGNTWKTDVSPIDPTHTDGYCDCSPTCGDCDGPQALEALSARADVGVDSQLCDARNGTKVSEDWAGCWDSCVDCMGDDLSHHGIVKYMPEAMGLGIVGTENWTTFNVGHANSTGSWWLCKTDSPTHKGDCTWMGLADGLPGMPKFKGLALCA